MCDLQGSICGVCTLLPLISYMERAKRWGKMVAAEMFSDMLLVVTFPTFFANNFLWLLREND